MTHGLLWDGLLTFCGVFACCYSVLNAARRNRKGHK